MEGSKKQSSAISVRSFVTSLLVIFILMAASYLLTFLIPGGSYTRIHDANGNAIIDMAAGFQYVEGGIPFWKWLASPVLVLGASGGGTLIAVIVFLLVIGGVFQGLEQSGLMTYMLEKSVHRFGAVRYRLMAVLVLLFMTMGSVIGSFEECVPMVPMVVALAVNLGWDPLVGVGMSILAAGCGFAAGVCNPFTVGVAQQLAGLPMFSGVWMRLISFGAIYALLLGFLRHYAKRIEKPVTQRKRVEIYDDEVANAAMDKGLLCFVSILGMGVLIILCSSFLTVLQDYTMIIIAVMFLVAGLLSSSLTGLEGKELARAFGKGVAGILPAVLMILMASSIRYTLEEAKILDTLLYHAMGLTETLPCELMILFIYLLVLVMNFFIPSGSAKAFMLIPIIVPMAQIFGISAQLCVMAFAFGDGFSNVAYPTNPALLISLGLADVSYSDWFRFSMRFQWMNLLLTGGILLLGLVVGY